MAKLSVHGGIKTLYTKSEIHSEDPEFEYRTQFAVCVDGVVLTKSAHRRIAKTESWHTTRWQSSGWRKSSLVASDNLDFTLDDYQKEEY